MVAASRRRVRTVGAVLAAGALLTAGCAGTADPGPLSPDAATDETATPSPTPAPDAGAVGDLRDRLLPASAFGEDATVVALTLEQLGTAGSSWGGWGGWGGGWPGPWGHGHGHGHGDADADGRPDEITVEPPACQALLDTLPSLTDDEDPPPALAAQAARTPQTQTVQVLTESPELAGAPIPVDQLVTDCASVTATGPWGWSTTVELSRLDVPPLGQQSAGVQVSVDWDGREEATVLVGFVVDGARGLLLAQSAAPGSAAPDPAAFAALLADAAQAAAG